MYTGTTPSKYKSAYVLLMCFTVVSFALHIGFGLTVFPKDMVEKTYLDFLNHEQFDSSTVSFLTVIFFQLVVSAFLLSLVFIRQALSALGYWRYNKIDHPILLFAASFAFTCALFFSPLNLDIFYSSDPKLRSLPNWMIMLLMTVLWGVMTPYILAMLIDPRTLNTNHALIYKKEDTR